MSATSKLALQAGFSDRFKEKSQAFFSEPEKNSAGIR
jgi:hypothetical protein